MGTGLRTAITSVLLAFIVLLGSVAVEGVALAQDETTASQTSTTVPAAPRNEAPGATQQQELREGTKVLTGRADLPVGTITFKTPFEQWLTLLTIATLAVTLGALTAMGWRSGLTPDFVRAFIVIVVVFSALFLIAAGYSDKQAAPVYALLGTIVGYIFGKMSGEEPAKEPADPD